MDQLLSVNIFSHFGAEFAACMSLISSMGKSGTLHMLMKPSESPRSKYFCAFPFFVVVTRLIDGGHDSGCSLTFDKTQYK